MRSVVSLAIAAILAPLAAVAAAPIKPGLWETTRTTETSGMPPMDMSNVPPERRAKMEEMMKQRQAAGPRTATSTFCITPEKLERDPFEKHDEEKGCKRTMATQTATKWKGKVVCEGERNSTGEFEMEFLSPTSMRQNMTMTMTRGPNTMTVKSSGTSKWLGADCGEKAKKK